MKRPVAFEAAAARSTGSWAFPRGEGGRRCVPGSRTSVLRRRAGRAGSASSPRFQPVWGLRAGGPHTVGFCTWWGLQSGKQLTGHGSEYRLPPWRRSQRPWTLSSGSTVTVLSSRLFPFLSASARFSDGAASLELGEGLGAAGPQTRGRRRARAGRSVPGGPHGVLQLGWHLCTDVTGAGAASLCSGATAAPGPSPARGPQTSALI